MQRPPAPLFRPAALASVAALLSAASAGAMAVDLEDVDLRTWQQQGLPAAGTWTVQGDGDSVLQTINGAPTYFVSPGSFIDTTLKGSIEVETGGDDDYIGFVFGYQDPTGTDAARKNFLLFDWKQRDQSFGGNLAEAGMALTRVDGSFDSASGVGGSAGDATYFFGHPVDTGPTPDADGVIADVLATDFGADRGWEDNTRYDFELDYTTDRIRIGLSGGVFGDAIQSIFDVSAADAGLDAFPEGRFGFYNYSQSNVRYTGFTTAAVPIDPVDPIDPAPPIPDPTPTPTPPNAVPSPSAAAAGLLLLSGVAARRRRR